MTVPAAAEPVHVVVESGGANLADWLGLLLTFALVAITAVYVWHTSRMADRMDEQLSAMREQQRHADETRLREKSERGAYDCLNALEGFLAEYESRPPAAVDREAFVTARLKLRRAAPLVHDRHVRDHLDSFMEVAFVGTFDAEQVDRERLDGGTVRLVARDMARRLTTVLHAYLAEDPIPENAWMRDGGDGYGDRFPPSAEAASWIRRYAARSSD